MWCVYINRSSEEAPFSFLDLLALQEKVLEEFLPHQRSAMLFAEVTPTVTLGARQLHDENQKERLEELKSTLSEAGIAVQAGGRGGKETWHGPGQWVVFLVTPLEKFSGDPRGVRKAVCKILNDALDVVKTFVPEARIEEGDRLGVWSPSGKLVSVGIQVKKGYLSSGFAVNCFPHPHSFYGISPCGLAGERPDFLFQNRLAQSDWLKTFEALPAKIFDCLK